MNHNFHLTQGGAMRTTLTVIVVFVFVFAIQAGLAQAEAGLQLEPGQWEIAIEVMLPMQTEPTKQLFSSCMGEELVTPQTIMPWAEAQGCRIRRVEVEESTMEWKLSCKLNGERSRGAGSFTSHGETADGEAKIFVEMAGRRIAIITKWDARRIGECVPKPEE
jgi:hypothetical protein